MKRSPTHTRRLLLVAGAVLTITPSLTSLRAQGPGVFDAFAARKDSPSDPVFGGLGITGYSGIFGLRLSGALNFNGGSDNSSQNTSPQYYRCDRYQCRGYNAGNYSYDNGWGIGIGGWSVDADLLIAPFRTLPYMKALLLGFSPYGFLGVGGAGFSSSNGADTNTATWSYGVGVHHDLIGWLGLSGEARTRRSLHTSEINIGSSRNWEYRLGLSISFGGLPTSAPDVMAGINVPSDQTLVNRFETAESASRITARVLDRAEEFVDTPYRSGSTNPSIGFDAAGFVQYVFAKEGIALPRTSHAIAELGEEISTRVGTLRPGDLLFFSNDGLHIDHVAIYAGHERMIHATASGGAVRYDVLGEGPRGEWFADHLVTARRLVAEGRALPSVRRDDVRDEGELDSPDHAPRARTRDE